MSMALCLAGDDMFDNGFHANVYTAGFAGTADKAMKEALDGNLTTVCGYEELNFGSLANQACCTLNVYVNDHGDSQNPATGWIHDMTSTYCKPGECAWDYGGVAFTAEPHGIAVSVKDLPEAFLVTKSILKSR